MDMRYINNASVDKKGKKNRQLNNQITKNSQSFTQFNFDISSVTTISIKKFKRIKDTQSHQHTEMIFGDDVTLEEFVCLMLIQKNKNKNILLQRALNT